MTKEKPVLSKYYQTILLLWALIWFIDQRFEDGKTLVNFKGFAVWLVFTTLILIQMAIDNFLLWILLTMAFLAYAIWSVYLVFQSSSDNVSVIISVGVALANLVICFLMLRVKPKK